MSRFDPLLMHAVITRVEAERPALDLELVVALYHHLTGLDGPQPTFEALLEYLDRVEPWLGEGGLRELLGLTPQAQRGWPAAAAAERPVGDSSVPGRGRPRGTGQLTASAVRAAHEAFRVERGRRPTQAELASRLDVATRSLQRFLHDHCLGWPLEG
ncbi:MAG: hypothetical protein ACM3KG_00360 [Hyphomicrobiales bacterium]